MANGDYIILRRTTADLNYGTDQLWTQTDWENQVHIDTDTFGHSTSVDPEQITLKATGHYLVGWNQVCDDDTHIYYFCPAGGFNLNATDLPYGHGSTFSYQYSSYADDPMPSGGTIINNPTADYILEVHRKHLGYQGADLEPDTGMFALKLDDTWAYFRAAVTTGTDDLTIPDLGTWINVDFSSTVDEKDTGFTHSTVTNPDQIQLDTAGDYLVLANIMIFDDSGGSRKRSYAEISLTLDDVEIDGTLVGTYVRNSSSGGIADTQYKGIQFIVTTTSSNQILRMRVRHNNESAKSYMAVHERAIAIVKLPASGVDMFNISQSANQESNDAPKTLPFNVNTRVDTGSFAHSITVDNDTVTMQQSAMVLLIGGAYWGYPSYPAVATTTRHRWDFEINASAKNYGAGDIWTRGRTGAAQHGHHGGSTHMMLVDLSSADDITWGLTDVGNGNSADLEYQADTMVFQGLNVDQWFTPAEGAERRVILIT